MGSKHQQPGGGLFAEVWPDSLFTWKTHTYTELFHYRYLQWTEEWTAPATVPEAAHTPTWKMSHGKSSPLSPLTKRTHREIQ